MPKRCTPVSVCPTHEMQSMGVNYCSYEEVVFTSAVHMAREHNKNRTEHTYKSNRNSYHKMEQSTTTCRTNVNKRRLLRI